MRFISDIYKEKKSEGKPVVSFEFFPPKTPEGEVSLMEKTIPSLMELSPDYCSMTYGAGGSTREKTMDIVDQIQRKHQLTAMAHLTCVNSTEEELRQVTDEARHLGIHNILALRGDPPGGEGAFEKTEGGFEFSYQLVEFLKSMGGFCIGTAGFPEGHVACKEGKEVDWQHLKGKIDCGADFVITQLFFNNEDFFAFRDYLSALGVTIPICPGIIPILSGNQIKRFTALCGASLPPALLEGLEKCGDDKEATTQFGIDYATAQCRELLDNGVPGVHFYTLNKAKSTKAILQNLGLT